MFEFKTLENTSVLAGIISKDVFDALAEGKMTIINALGKKEKINEVKFFSENGPHIQFEGWEKYIRVGFYPCENQNLEEVEPLEVFLSKIDLKGIEKDSFYSNFLEIFDINYVNGFGVFKNRQFTKMKIKPIEQEGL